MNIKKSAAFLLSLCFLVACSSSPKILRNTNPNEEKTEIHFLTTTTAGRDVPILNTMIEQFQKSNENVSILFENYEITGNSKLLYEFINQRVANGKANDIVTMDVANIFAYAEEGKLLDLSNTEAGKQLNTYARKDSVINGSVMSLPLSMTSYGIWVNMDILEKCGLSIPNNWEEFLYCCEVLKEKGYQPILGSKNFPKLFILASMGDIYAKTDSEAIIAQLNSGEVKISSYARQGMERLATLVNKEYIDAQTSLELLPNQTIEPFKNQQGVFTIGTSSRSEPKDFEFETNFIGIPGNHGMMNMLASDRRLVIMNDSEHKEECVEFLSYLGNAEVQKEVTATFGILSAYQSEAALESPDARLKQLYDNINAGRVMLIQDYNIKFEQWGNLNGIANAILAGSSVESQMEALDQIQATAIAENQ